MKCPECKGRTRVYETKLSASGTVLRRRQCLDASCGEKVRTEERPCLVVTRTEVVERRPA